MRNALNFILFLCVCIFFPPPVSFGEADSSIKLPIAFIPVNRFEFKKVVEGGKVSYDFKVINKGDATLNINKVKTG